MMNNWNSVIFLKTEKSSSDMMNMMSKWDGIENMWSTTGDWDWCIKLDSKSSSPEKTEEFVNRMREGHWATQTKTNWWKQIDKR
ncbi:hypothetical protein Lqui_2258 [Legionella quinlivanii]|uniref:Transcription regulator AsnC/Lrp ligand binding domain-containing protein n=2 Tax=Legionella quinlivanii TaxID=45073 RepID=A0A0W0XTU0_9GAMM|nr:hypothetical protein Lqui_2258 [Legionella quinlivanii]SEG20837.1 hypothetical protein SAMN02746093_02184 [Legionella quinlivanii DSM 21216]STY11106.1 Uncharacterised protein [Legionella quinlivanii]